MARLLDLLPAFAAKRIVVLGDLILDEYVLGAPSRVSREAPIVVLEFARRVVLPGGGTAPACNIQALGGQAAQVGVIGADAAGTELRHELDARSVDTRGLVVDAGRPTILKSRIVAEGPARLQQQIARIDTLDRRPINSGVEHAVIASLEAALPGADALLISDYMSGTVTAEVVAAARRLAQAQGILITVDAQGAVEKFAGVTVFRCNHREAEEALRTPLRSEADFQAGLRRLQADLRVEGVVVTRGPDGMAVLDPAGAYHHIPVDDTAEVFDVTGAGDTVIAVLTLALTAGASLLDAARLANYGAGVVVQKVGNVPLHLEELRRRLLESADE
ncbi:MAG TPA: bifunctional ADP-heptose synthase [Chloroflexia bacterium]|nr:bifunctional ADP-heptose synthase [Chloroflexia bacterium]